MSDLFAGVYGAKFPDVVMNSGPLPPSGGLPAPLHDTPDGQINYGSTLLGDLQPYAYGAPGYQSSQSAYLNIPHRIQKFVPVLHLPEPSGGEVFRLSHAVDDSDIAFVMRLNRNSIFCTGTRCSSKRAGIGSVVDPLINLATLNYLLAGFQLMGEHRAQSLWWELLFNLDRRKWPHEGRNYSTEQDPAEHELLHEPFGLDDLIHLVRNCIRPLGVVRGSEKQGGQSEMSNGPATWPVPAICTLVIDGKEANVINLWHRCNVDAGRDLVLRFKPMPLATYTLNHYYKGFARKTFEAGEAMVWQLVPDVFDPSLDTQDDLPLLRAALDRLPGDPLAQMPFKCIKTEQLSGMYRYGGRGWSAAVPRYHEIYHDDPTLFVPVYAPWQELGFWHIGRSQVRITAYGVDESYNNDMANDLKTNHLEMTFQPTYQCLPRVPYLGTFLDSMPFAPTRMNKEAGRQKKLVEERPWAPSLGLERLGKRGRDPKSVSFCLEPSCAAPRLSGPSCAAPRPSWPPSTAPRLSGPSCGPPRLSWPPRAAPSSLRPRAGAPELAAVASAGAPELAAVASAGAPGPAAVASAGVPGLEPAPLEPALVSAGVPGLEPAPLEPALVSAGVPGLEALSEPAKGRRRAKKEVAGVLLSKEGGSEAAGLQML
jgi:hypothetical protein